MGEVGEGSSFDKEGGNPWMGRVWGEAWVGALTVVEAQVASCMAGRYSGQIPGEVGVHLWS